MKSKNFHKEVKLKVHLEAVLDCSPSKMVK